jgi:hypothetical protein
MKSGYYKDRGNPVKILTYLLFSCYAEPRFYLRGFFFACDRRQNISPSVRLHANVDVMSFLKVRAELLPLIWRP